MYGGTAFLSKCRRISLGDELCFARTDESSLGVLSFHDKTWPLQYRQICTLKNVFALYLRENLVEGVFWLNYVFEIYLFRVTRSSVINSCFSTRPWLNNTTTIHAWTTCGNSQCSYITLQINSESIPITFTEARPLHTGNQIHRRHAGGRDMPSCFINLFV